FWYAQYGEVARLPRSAGPARRPRSASLRAPLAPFARRIFVRVRFLRTRTKILRYIAQVHADPRPRRRAAAHRIDEDVVYREAARRLGVPFLPPLEPGQRLLLLRGVGHRDQRHLGAGLLGNTSRPRRRHPRRFAIHL